METAHTACTVDASVSLIRKSEFHAAYSLENSIFYTQCDRLLTWLFDELDQAEYRIEYECNRISNIKKLGKTFTYEDRLNPEKSEEMVIIYLSFWGNQYERKTKQTATLEVLAKIHNGHAFWNRSKSDQKNAKYFRNLEHYWNKVKKEL